MDDSVNANGTQDIRPKDSLYQGKTKFDRDQLVFMVETILIGVLDRVQSHLPSDCDWDSTVTLGLGSYERGALEAAGMALAVLYCNLTGDGMGIGDALNVADYFDAKIEDLYAVAWEDKGVAVKRREAELRQTTYQIPSLYTNWPNVHHCATVFVHKAFDCYILGDPHFIPNDI